MVWALKKMKKDYQVLSLDQDVQAAVHTVEVECSASDGFCSKLGVSSFPTIKLVEKGGSRYMGYTGDRKMGAMRSFLLDPSSWTFDGNLKLDGSASVEGGADDDFEDDFDDDFDDEEEVVVDDGRSEKAVGGGDNDYSGDYGALQTMAFKDLESDSDIKV